jgi:hypothetical protein
MPSLLRKKGASEAQLRLVHSYSVTLANIYFDFWMVSVTIQELTLLREEVFLCL